jgi:predicted RNase H-like HicB family nuclease
MHEGKIKVKVLLHQAEEGGYWVEVPSLPACVSQGETKHEALANIKEALLMHLESLGSYRKVPSNSGKSQVATVALGA